MRCKVACHRSRQSSAVVVSRNLSINPPVDWWVRAHLMDKRMGVSEGLGAANRRSVSNQYASGVIALPGSRGPSKTKTPREGTPERAILLRGCLNITIGPGA